MRAWTWAAALGLALAPLLLVRPVLVRGRSMAPNLPAGAYLIGLRAWVAGDPGRGEVWLVRTAEGDLVKRVVGLPGETLAQREGALWREGRRMSEPYVHVLDEGNGGPWACGQGYFVAGDNRRESRDSRVFGPLPRSAFVARLWGP